MAVWYCSDIHLSHRKVSELRGFTNPADHDAALAENWDRLVRNGDIVWVLGDISVGGKLVELRALQWITARPGVKHLVCGNHDSCHPMRSVAHKWLPVYQEKAFASAAMAATRKIAGHRVLLSHLPYAGSEDGDTPGMENRFEEWRLPDTGQWLLHGHTHNPDQRVHGRMIHVGLDAHGLTPIPESWIADVIANP